MCLYRIQSSNTGTGGTVRQVRQRRERNMCHQPRASRPRHGVLVQGHGHAARTVGKAHADRHGLDRGPHVKATHFGRHTSRLGQLLLRADRRRAGQRQRARHQRRTPRSHAARQQEHGAAHPFHTLLPCIYHNCLRNKAHQMKDLSFRTTAGLQTFTPYKIKYNYVSKFIYLQFPLMMMFY